MADRLYGAGLADFMIALGEEGFVYSDATTATTKTGRTVLVQTPAGTGGDPLVTVKVFDAKEGTQLTELYDSDGAEVSVLTIPTSWIELGQLLQFTVRDTETQTPPEGDVWLTGNELTGPWARAVPFTAELFERLGVVETALNTLGTDDLVNFADTAPTNGQVPVFDNGTGLWTPGTVPGTGVETVAGVAPIDGDVPITIDTIGAASDTVVQGIADNYLYLHLGDSSGYPALLPTGKPIYGGPVDPGPNLIGKLWLQPVSP